jgi:hypothetical protein
LIAISDEDPNGDDKTVRAILAHETLEAVENVPTESLSGL